MPSFREVFEHLDCNPAEIPKVAKIASRIGAHESDLDTYNSAQQERILADISKLKAYLFRDCRPPASNQPVLGQAYTLATGARGVLANKLLHERFGINIAQDILPKNAVYLSKTETIIPGLSVHKEKFAASDAKNAAGFIEHAAKFAERILLALAIHRNLNIVHEGTLDPKECELFFLTLATHGYFSDKLKLLFVAADYETRKKVFKHLEGNDLITTDEQEFLNPASTMALLNKVFRMPVVELFWLDNATALTSNPKFIEFGFYNGVANGNVTLFKSAEPTVNAFKKHVADEATDRGMANWINGWPLSSHDQAPKICSTEVSPCISRVSSVVNLAALAETEEARERTINTLEHSKGALLLSLRANNTVQQDDNNRMLYLDDDDYVHKPSGRITDSSAYAPRQERNSSSPQSGTSTSSAEVETRSAKYHPA